jgi:LysR family hydrogen peroxide-inducible transcriptional activator
MPSITQMQYIAAVHKHQHFGKAAKACFVSQPTLSNQIQKAEQELGYALFDRSKKPLRLTKEGDRLLPHIHKILDDYELLKSELTSDTELSGELRVGIIPTLAPYVIPLFVHQFSQQYPKVDLVIHEQKTEDIIHNLQHDFIDAGLLVTPINEKSLHPTPLFREPFYIFSSPDSKINAKKTITVNDLEPNKMWLLDEGHCFRNQAINVCAIAQKENVLPNVTFSSGSLETLIQLIRKSEGYTLLPFLATEHLTPTEKDTQLKPFHTSEFSREVSLIRGRKVLKHSLITALSDVILDVIPQSLRDYQSTDSLPVSIYKDDHD